MTHIWNSYWLFVHASWHWQRQHLVVSGLMCVAIVVVELALLKKYKLTLKQLLGDKFLSN